MTEPKRKQGYYLDGNIQYPSVSTVKDVLAKNGLLSWAATQGAIRTHLFYSKLVSNQEDLPKLIDMVRSHDALERVKTLGVLGYEEGGNYARFFGSCFHKAIELHLKNEPIPKETIEWDEALMKAVATATDFVDTVDLKPIVMEKYVVDKDERYSGRLDLIGTIDKGKWDGLFGYMSRNSETLEEGNWIVDYKTGSLYTKDNQLQLAAYRGAWNKANPDNPIRGGLMLNVDKNKPDKIKLVYYSENTLEKVYNDAWLPLLKVWRFHAPQKWHRQFT